MAEIFEIDLDSKYVLVSKNPLSKEDYDRIIESWAEFVGAESPVLFIIDGTEYEFVVKAEDEPPIAD